MRFAKHTALASDDHLSTPTIYTLWTAQPVWLEPGECPVPRMSYSMEHLAQETGQPSRETCYVEYAEVRHRSYAPFRKLHVASTTFKHSFRIYALHHPFRTAVAKGL